MAEVNVNATATETEPATPGANPAEMTLQHDGGGWYTVAGQRIRGKEKAQQYLASLAQITEQLDAPDLSDIVPENYKIRDNTYIFRGNRLELPMNETHFLDGSLNPMYDREWYWGWVAYGRDNSPNRSSGVPDRLSNGWELVDYETFDTLINEGRVPEHLRHMLRAEGRYLVYSDLVIMRIPRYLRRQQLAEKEKRLWGRFREQEQDTKDELANAGVPVVPSPIGSGLKTEISQKGANEIEF